MYSLALANDGRQSPYSLANEHPPQNDTCRDWIGCNLPFSSNFTNPLLTRREPARTFEGHLISPCIPFHHLIFFLTYLFPTSVFPFLLPSQPQPTYLLCVPQGQLYLLFIYFIHSLPSGDLTSFGCLLFPSHNNPWGRLGQEYVTGPRSLRKLPQQNVDLSLPDAGLKA